MCTLTINRAQCGYCKQIIASVHRHDYTACKCGGLAVDGGRDYARRVYQSGLEWVELSEYRTCDDSGCLLRGSGNDETVEAAS